MSVFHFQIGSRLFNVEELRGAAALLRLDRRAFYAAVAAENAAVAMPGLEHGSAALAVIEKLAGVGRHGFPAGETALGTGDGAFQNDLSCGHVFSRQADSRYPVTPRAAAESCATPTAL